MDLLQGIWVVAFVLGAMGAMARYGYLMHIDSSYPNSLMGYAFVALFSMMLAFTLMFDLGGFNPFWKALWSWLSIYSSSQITVAATAGFIALVSIAVAMTALMGAGFQVGMRLADAAKKNAPAMRGV
jgi:hypothetical protein